ncbi:GNAT family N-acetyltransferase [Solimonas soli]|uniref:GNAT family N-acetyltransferase n=1 Tax=Solimonas soli TaxID=413479 RepID=UPI0012F8B42E|nr:GNAT family N-acetyltransferase [Solimonas soli]
MLLRDARREDAGALAALVRASGPAAFDYVFACGGRSAEAFLRAALDDGRGLLGWPHHRVALHGERIVACMALYDANQLATLAQASLWQYFRLYRPWSAMRVIHRALQIGAMQPPPAAGDLYIAHLSVADDLRRRGIATRLLHEALQIARRRGHTHCALDVARDNEAALALYRLHGFRLEAERALPDGGHQVPPSRRLRCAV